MCAIVKSSVHVSSMKRECGTPQDGLCVRSDVLRRKRAQTVQAKDLATSMNTDEASVEWVMLLM